MLTFSHKIVFANLHLLKANRNVVYSVLLISLMLPSCFTIQRKHHYILYSSKTNYRWDIKHIADSLYSNLHVDTLIYYNGSYGVYGDIEYLFWQKSNECYVLRFKQGRVFQPNPYFGTFNYVINDIFQYYIQNYHCLVDDEKRKTSLIMFDAPTTDIFKANIQHDTLNDYIQSPNTNKPCLKQLKLVTESVLYKIDAMGGWKLWK